MTKKKKKKKKIGNPKNALFTKPIHVKQFFTKDKYYERKIKNALRFVLIWGVVGIWCIYRYHPASPSFNEMFFGVSFFTENSLKDFKMTTKKNTWHELQKKKK